MKYRIALPAAAATAAMILAPTVASAAQHPAPAPARPHISGALATTTHRGLPPRATVTLSNETVTINKPAGAPLPGYQLVFSARGRAAHERVTISETGLFEYINGVFEFPGNGATIIHVRLPYVQYVSGNDSRSVVRDVITSTQIVEAHITPGEAPVQESLRVIQYR